MPNKTGSYVEDMSSYQAAMSTKNPMITNDYPNVPSIIAHQNQSSTKNEKFSRNSSSMLTSRWDWLIFNPSYHSEIDNPSSIVVTSPILDENLNEREIFENYLPSFLVRSLSFRRTSVSNSDDENENDVEIRSLEMSNVVRRNNSLNTADRPDETMIKSKRSSTPDTDDGYQSASDASRSDYSNPSSSNVVDLTINQSEESSSSTTTRLTYAAAAKPTSVAVLSNQTSRGQTSNNKGQKSSNFIENNEQFSANNNAKLKFIAPRFERIHNAKQTENSNGSNKKSTNSMSSNKNSNRNSNSRTHPSVSTRRR